MDDSELGSFPYRTGKNGAGNPNDRQRNGRNPASSRHPVSFGTAVSGGIAENRSGNFAVVSAVVTGLYDCGSLGKICHTDAYTLDGLDSEGIFPSVLGHEGAGIVREIGAGVTSVKPGDHVIPLYTPECRQCKSCLSGKTNLCTAIRATQGKGVMPDGTSRFSHKGATIFHYMGCSTFSNFTVLPEIAVAKIRDDAPFQTSCYIGCGVTTGVGAVVNTAKVRPGENVIVFGLGGIGLNVLPPPYPVRGPVRMDFDCDRIDEAVLALLWLNVYVAGIAWKGFDWQAMERLYKRCLISSPVGKAKSVRLTGEGLIAGQRLFRELFARRQSPLE